jgi:hypothetical protein
MTSMRRQTLLTDATDGIALVVARVAQALLSTMDDKAEGAGPFLANRPPVFQGR